MSPEPAERCGWPELLTALVYELLDAHHDTVMLAEELPDEDWRWHIDYLRALQREGRELLAKAWAAVPQPSADTPDDRPAH